MNSQAGKKNTLKTCSLGCLNVFEHVLGSRRRIHSMLKSNHFPLFCYYICRHDRSYCVGTASST